MRIIKIAALVASALTVMAAPQSQAQMTTNLFPVSFHAVCTSTNSGGLVRSLVVNSNLIADCAADQNITNVTDLRLVYNVTNNSVQVVGSNGVAVCTAFTFTGGLAFTNTNSTRVVFQYNVLYETNLTATGTASGSASWNTTNFASTFGLRAGLFYIEPASGTNAASICRALLRAGSAISNEGDEDEDNDDHGGGHRPPNNPGNHLGWQNPHNPHHGP